MISVWLAIAGVTCAGLLAWALAPSTAGDVVPRLRGISMTGNPRAMSGALTRLIARLLGRATKPAVIPPDLTMLHPELARKKQEETRQGLIPALLSLGSRLLPTMPESQAKELGGRLSYVGVELTPQEFVGLKIVSMIGCGLGTMMLLPDLIHAQLLVLVAAVFIGFMAPEVWLRSRIAIRHKAMLRLLPEVIDLLSLCMGAGLDFLGALNRVIAVKAGTEKKKEPLLEELTVVMQEIKFGKRRAEALKAMSKRVNLTELSSFVRTLVQADRMGTPIKDVLVLHAEDVRFERYNRAERAALKAPIKILVPLIFCILPCVAIIVGAPIFLQFAHLKIGIK